jgi:hypothetical protein
MHDHRGSVALRARRTTIEVRRASRVARSLDIEARSGVALMHDHGGSVAPRARRTTIEVRRASRGRSTIEARSGVALMHDH